MTDKSLRTTGLVCYTSFKHPSISETRLKWFTSVGYICKIMWIPWVFFDEAPSTVHWLINADLSASVFFSRILTIIPCITICKMLILWACNYLHFKMLVCISTHLRNRWETGRWKWAFWSWSDQRSGWKSFILPSLEKCLVWTLKKMQ